MQRKDGFRYYLTKNAPSLSMRLAGERVRANAGVLELTDEQADELDRLRNSGKRPDLTQLVRPLDEVEASALANLDPQRQSAVRGALSSSHDPVIAQKVLRLQNSDEYKAASKEDRALMERQLLGGKSYDGNDAKLTDAQKAEADRLAKEKAAYEQLNSGGPKEPELPTPPAVAPARSSPFGKRL